MVTVNDSPRMWAQLLDLSCVSGTLTQNEMVFKRLHLGTVAYGLDSMDEVQSHIFSIYTQVKPFCFDT